MLIDVLKVIGSVTVMVESVPEILADFPNCRINPLLNSDRKPEFTQRRPAIYLKFRCRNRSRNY